jgi:hypothetical protein
MTNQLKLSSLISAVRVFCFGQFCLKHGEFPYDMCRFVFEPGGIY